jgi:O-antigen ligase
MLAGASWGLFAMRPVVFSLPLRVALVLGGFVVLFAQVLTGGRGGYLAWGTVGLTLGLARWRRYLVLAPLIIILVLSFVPSAAERALDGLHGSAGTSEEVDLEELTAGRNLLWPPVIEKIWDAPFLGYGRAAMQRTGLTAWFAASEQEEKNLIQHPHNAYLEMLLDSGATGLLVTLALYGTFLAIGFSLLRDPHNPEFVGIGGVALSLILSQLVGAFTGQSFWPREATVGMWCAIGLMLRVWAQRSHLYSDSRAGGARRIRAARTDSVRRALGSSRIPDCYPFERSDRTGRT